VNWLSSVHQSAVNFFFIDSFGQIANGFLLCLLVLAFWTSERTQLVYDLLASSLSFDVISLDASSKVSRHVLHLYGRDGYKVIIADS